MSGKGIKIKELARELGITSRTLIDRCRAEGIPVQNSITRLGVDDARRARQLFHGAVADSEPPLSNANPPEVGEPDIARPDSNGETLVANPDDLSVNANLVSHGVAKPAGH